MHTSFRIRRSLVLVAIVGMTFLPSLRANAQQEDSEWYHENTPAAKSATLEDQASDTTAEAKPAVVQAPPSSPSAASAPNARALEPYEEGVSEHLLAHPVEEYSVSANSNESPAAAALDPKAQEAKHQQELAAYWKINEEQGKERQQELAAEAADQRRNQYLKNPSMRWDRISTTQAMAIPVFEGKPVRTYSVLMPLSETAESGADACLRIRKQAVYYGADAVIDIKQGSEKLGASPGVDVYGVRRGGVVGAQVPVNSPQMVATCSGSAVRWGE